LQIRDLACRLAAFLLSHEPHLRTSLASDPDGALPGIAQLLWARDDHGLGLAAVRGEKKTKRNHHIEKGKPKGRKMEK